MIDQKAADAFSAARSNLLLDHYFFGRLAMYLTPVQQAEADCPTLAVDGKHVFYNPKFFMSLSVSLRRSAIAHEVMHCVMEHTIRRRGRDPGTWNKAGDYVINLLLEQAKFRIGDNWLINKAFAGMSSEEVYNIIKQDEQKSSGNGGSGHGPGLCDVRDAPDTGSDQDLTSVKQQWSINVAQAAMEAKSQGSMPGFMERYVDDIASNKVPWRNALQEFFSARAKDDYSWTRPNRMFAGLGLYLPSMYSEAMGPIDVVIDTSGSIGAKELAEFGAEIQAIVQATRPQRVRVMYADADVNHVDVFEQGEPLEFHAHGGGGTDFRPALALAEEDPPVALVYLTDMYGTFPEVPPDYPVLWCATSHVEGPFGRTIYIGDD